MQTLNQFFTDLLTLDEKRKPTKDEQTLINKGQLLDVVFQRIVSTKFRRSSLDKETTKAITTYLKKTIPAEKPLRLYFLFGGYKQARLTSAPNPEWAEIFTIAFALKAASYIESIYTPGVDVIYRGDEVVLTYLDNYKPEARAIYTTKFSQMLDLFRETIPTDRKISLKYELTSETSPPEKLFPFMERVFPKYRKQFEALPKEEQVEKLLRSYRNHMWHGNEDLTHLSKAAKQKRAKWAYIMHDAFLEADVTIAEKYFENGVSISFRKKLEGCIHYASCLTSSVQFWAGEGFISKKENAYLPWILSYEQQQTIASTTLAVTHAKFKKLGLRSIRLYKSA